MHFYQIQNFFNVKGICQRHIYSRLSTHNNVHSHSSFFVCIIIILFLCRSFSTQMLLLVSVTKSQEWFIFLFLINEKCVRKKKFMKNFIGKEDILQIYLWRIQKRISRVFETDTATTLTWDHANPVTSVSIKSLLCGRRSLGINNENIYLNICMFLSHALHERLGKVHRMHPLI